MKILLFLISFLIATPAQAVILFQDNFDSYTDMNSFKAVWDVSSTCGCYQGVCPPTGRFSLQPDNTDHFSGTQSLHSSYDGQIDSALNFIHSCFANILPI